MLRRFLIAIVLFLIIVVVVADRVGAIVAAHVLAGKVQTDEGLQNRPSASVGGIPFLTQAFGGSYKDVKLTDHQVLVNDVSVTTLTAELHGVHVPLSHIIHGSVSQVPVDRVVGTAFVSFADANAYLAKHLPAGRIVKLSAGTNGQGIATVKATVAGHQVAFHAPFTPSVSGDVVGVALGAVKGSHAASNLVGRVVSHLTVQIPLQSLPFQLTLTSVKVGATGLSAAGHSDHVVLGSHH